MNIIIRYFCLNCIATIGLIASILYVYPLYNVNIANTVQRLEQAWLSCHMGNNSHMVGKMLAWI